MKRKRATLSVRRRKLMMFLYTGFLFLLALAIALMPLGSATHEETKRIVYFCGGGFWIGLIGTVVMALIINCNRKNCAPFRERYGKVKQLGLIHFFRNPQAAVADVFLCVSVIGLVIARICNSNNYIAFIFLAAVVFSFGMHCMLNGINYKYINYKVRKEET